MMILRSAAASPFARKVRIAIALLGLSAKVEVRAADANDPADTLRQQNPVGKIPTLIADDGIAYYDSRVILEYLDHLAGGGKIVPSRFPWGLAAEQYGERSFSRWRKPEW